MIIRRIIVVDFDGTCVTHEFPFIGKEIGAPRVLRKLSNAGHKLILSTMRSNVTKPKSKDPNIINEPGNYLDQAVEWFRRNNIPLFGIQTNPTQKTWTTSPKPYGQLYIDDCGAMIALKFDQEICDRPFVDWEELEKWLIKNNYLES